MIKHEKEFRKFLAEEKKLPAPSIDSYVRYLNAVSKKLGDGIAISPALLQRHDDASIAEEARMKAPKPPAESYVKKWRSALNHYRQMCRDYGFFPK